MEAKSLKKLNRRELLELMVKISEQNETLEQENKSLKAQLENRRLSAREVGSLAQASLEATDLFIAADTAARVYLENIVRIEKETQERSNKLLEETLLECINMRAASGFGPDELLPPDWRAQVQAVQDMAGVAPIAVGQLAGTDAAGSAVSPGGAPSMSATPEGLPVQPAAVQPGVVQPGVVPPGAVQPGAAQPGVAQAAPMASNVAGNADASASQAPEGTGADTAEKPKKKRGLFGRKKKS